MSSLLDIFKDDTGKYDEARVAFLAGFATMIWGAVYSTLYPDHPFHAEDFSVGLGALLGLYNASKGKIGKIGGGS